MRIAKFLFLYFIFSLCTGDVFAQKATDDFSGNWKTEEGATIEMSKKDGGYIGIGLATKKIIVKDLQFKAGKWVSEITNPLKNITANGEFILEPNRLKIIARKSIFSKTIYWTKVN